MRIIQRLADAGFVAYFAGGCVRDALLGRSPKDFDVATNATPESVRDVFGKRKTLAFGASFGVIAVLPEKETRQKLTEAVEPTEVATFRSDGTYSDGRRPDSVHYGNAEEDAKRRDFTINGLFYDPLANKVIDFVGGRDDLEQRLLRAIGDAAHRFDEDKLRMLRAVRMATVIGFSIDPDTLAAIGRHADTISLVSGERVGAEMRRILSAPRAADGLDLVQDTGLGRTILPEFANVDRQRVRSHLADLPVRDFPSAMACALIGAGFSAGDLDAIVKRWKLSNEEQRQIKASIESWKLYAQSDSLPWSKVQPNLIDRDAHVILNVARAVTAAQQLDDSGVRFASEALNWPGERLNPAPLLTGDDLRDAGIPSGPAYREILQTLRDKQLDNEISTHEEALKLAQSMQ